MSYIGRALLGVILFLLGNYLGDQATIKDCAITGHATMLGGGEVACGVVRSGSQK